MIYEVRARLFFVHEDDANDFMEHCVESMVKAVVVHPDEENQEGCSVELIKCYHDETPTKPCLSCGSIHCP